MTKIYGYKETLQAMRLASEYFYPEAQQYGVSADGTGWNPYVEVILDDPTYAEQHRLSPIGATFAHLGMNLKHLEQLSADHLRWCEDYDCHVCSEEAGYADTSLYAPWVVDYIKHTWNVEFTEGARALLWEAESSGLTLREWYLNRLDILGAV